jgi:hypothetical protein
MGFRNSILILAVMICSASQVLAQDSYNIGPISEDVKKSFQNEDLFNTSAATGMSPNATANLVKYPIVVVRGSALVSGSWSLNLRDTAASTMRLNLNQYQDAVFGSGDITIGGIVTNVSVGGTIVGNRLNLYATTEGNNNLYRMTLTVAPGSMNGNYLFTAPGITQPGIVYGSLTAPAQTIPVQTGAPVSYNQPIQPTTMPIGPKNQY